MTGGEPGGALDVDVPHAQTLAFRRDGYVVLRGVLAKSCTDELRAAFDASRVELVALEAIRRPAGVVGVLPSLRNPRAHRGAASVARRLCAQTSFQRALGAVLDEEELVHFAAGFFRNVHRPSYGRYRWHCDFKTFSFASADSAGYTMWCPLDRVTAQPPRGGLAIASVRHVNGSSGFLQDGLTATLIGHGGNMAQELKRVPLLPELRQHIAAMQAAASSDEACIAELHARQMRAMEHVYESANMVAEANGVELCVDVGDVVLFRKDVYHRTVALQPGGALSERRAFVMRFADADGTFAAANFGSHPYQRGNVDLVGATAADVAETDAEMAQEMYAAGMRNGDRLGDYDGFMRMPVNKARRTKQHARL